MGLEVVPLARWSMDGLEQSQLTGTSYLVQSVHAGPYRPHSSGVKLLSLFYSVPVERVPRADQWKYRLCCSGTREIILTAGAWMHGCEKQMPGFRTGCPTRFLLALENPCLVPAWETGRLSWHGWWYARPMLWEQAASYLWLLCPSL